MLGRSPSDSVSDSLSDSVSESVNGRGAIAERLGQRRNTNTNRRKIVHREDGTVLEGGKGANP
jgi:hypothetical protein